MLDGTTIESIRKVAAELGIEPAALLAVVEVESGGAAFAPVGGRQEPLIRFEGHYFDRRLAGEKRLRARAAGLSSPVAGAVKNPKSQAGRWRLLERAAEIDRQAAHESVSWGIGQVMGAHWQWLGYGSFEELVAEARSGVEGQVRLMVRYIRKAGLLDALRQQDWKAFARGYNGPAYARHGYDSRLEAAYRRHAAAPSAVDDIADVRALQRMLTAAGYPLAVDGIVGPATRRAIRRFQADHELKTDGIAGPRTMEALQQALPFDGLGTGLWRGLLRWLARLLRFTEAR